MADAAIGAATAGAAAAAAAIVLQVFHGAGSALSNIQMDGCFRQNMPFAATRHPTTHSPGTHSPTRLPPGIRPVPTHPVPAHPTNEPIATLRDKSRSISRWERSFIDRVNYCCTWALLTDCSCGSSSSSSSSGSSSSSSSGSSSNSSGSLQKQQQ